MNTREGGQGLDHNVGCGGVVVGVSCCVVCWGGGLGGGGRGSCVVQKGKNMCRGGGREEKAKKWEEGRGRLLSLKRGAQGQLERRGGKEENKGVG